MIHSTWTEGIPRLVGDLAAVREVVASDVPTLFAQLSDPAVTAYMAPPPPSVAALAGFISWAQRERIAGRGMCFGIVPNGLTAAVGIIQIRTLELTFFTAEWGFALGRPFWSTGVFMEAANLVAGFAFATLKVHRLEARAVTHNARGNAALQKLGARAEGTLSSAFGRGARRDPQLLWSLSEEYWRQRPRAQQQGRLSADEAIAQIARAIADMQDTLVESRAAAEPIEGAEPYPFFLFDRRQREE